MKAHNIPSNPEILGPIEEIRRAAAMMREQAEGTTEGPWWVDATTTHTVVRGINPRGNGRPSRVAYTSGTRGAGLADGYHIASWHPAVAIAVADWLDATVETEQPVLPHLPHALDVAHTYLRGML